MSAHSVFRHAPAFVREALPHFNLLHYRLFSAVESVAGNFLGPVAAHHAAAVGSSLAMAAALLLPFFLLALALVLVSTTVQKGHSGLKRLNLLVHAFDRTLRVYENDRWAPHLL